MNRRKFGRPKCDEILPVDEDGMKVFDLLTNSSPMKAKDIFSVLGWKDDSHWRLERAIKRQEGAIQRVKFGYYEVCISMHTMECKICGQKLTKDSVHIHLSEVKKQQEESVSK